MKIDIVYNHGTSRISFDEEIVEFEISVQNPERLLYNVTMPTIVANIVIESTDQEFKSMRQGDKIEVYNASGKFLFHLMVVSVTFAEEVGRVEIEASGPPLIGDGLPHGMFKVTKDLVEKVYRNDVESMDEHLSGDKWGYLSGREDLMLAALWTDRKELMYITPSYHLMYGNKDTKPWVIFKEGSGLVPDYEVEFEDIVEMNITPARPPVTEIRTRESINQLDAAVLKNVRNAKTYYLEGKNLTAVYVHTNDGKSYLRWSDGIVTDLGSEPVQIVGIFSDSYIEWTETTSSVKVLAIKSRVTSNTIRTFSIPSDEDFMPGMSGLKTEPLVTTSDRYGEVYWFEMSTFSGSGSVFGIRKDEDGYSMLSTTIAVPRNYMFVTAREGHQALYAYFDKDEQRIYSVVVRVGHDGSIDRRVSEVDIDYRGFPLPYSARVVDARYSFDSPEKDVYLLRSVNGPDIETLVVRQNKQAAIVWGEARFVETSPDVEPDDLKIVVLFYDPAELATIGIFDVEGDLLTEESRLRILHLFGTTEGGAVRVNYHNKAGTYMLQDAEDTVLLFSNRSVPWAAATPGSLVLRRPIQRGEENIVSLPFIVGEIGDIDIPAEEEGRIELDIASYNVRGDTHKISVQDMRLSSLMSTFHVELVKGEPKRRMKVVGMHMKYDGVVSMRLSGILVPEKPALAPPSIAPTAYCDTFGTPQEPSYQFRISITNNAPVRVWLNVTIDGVLIRREVGAWESSIFTRSSSTPWTSVEVTAYASKDGYLDSDLVTASRTVVCALPTEPQKTEKPTINAAYCYHYFDSDTTELSLSITNNDVQEVTIYRGDTSSVLGVIPGGSTRTLIYGAYALPGSWSASITAQASGKTRSDLETGSGYIYYCTTLYPI